jgi:predicted O-methyltransferase YrrM
VPIAERPGSVTVAGNVVRHAAVADVNSRDEQVQGVRTFRDMVSDDPRLSATGVQTVGSKGQGSQVLGR